MQAPFLTVPYAMLRLNSEGLALLFSNSDPTHVETVPESCRLSIWSLSHSSFPGRVKRRERPGTGPKPPLLSLCQAADTLRPNALSPRTHSGPLLTILFHCSCSEPSSTCPTRCVAVAAKESERGVRRMRCDLPLCSAPLPCPCAGRRRARPGDRRRGLHHHLPLQVCLCHPQGSWET